MQPIKHLCIAVCFCSSVSVYADIDISVIKPDKLWIRCGTGWVQWEILLKGKQSHKHDRGPDKNFGLTKHKAKLKKNRGLMITNWYMDYCIIESPSVSLVYSLTL